MNKKTWFFLVLLLGASLMGQHISQGDILNAYIDNEYRGSAPAITNPFNEKLIFPLMVYCNEWNKSLTFKDILDEYLN